MKYCNDKEKAIIFVLAILGIIAIIRINMLINGAIDDIIYDAKHRHVMKQCDECIEKADKAHKENVVPPKDKADEPTQ
jgi:hypothetical protein